MTSLIHSHGWALRVRSSADRGSGPATRATLTKLVASGSLGGLAAVPSSSAYGLRVSLLSPPARSSVRIEVRVAQCDGSGRSEGAEWCRVETVDCGEAGGRNRLRRIIVAEPADIINYCRRSGPLEKGETVCDVGSVGGSVDGSVIEFGYDDNDDSVVTTTSLNGVTGDETAAAANTTANTMTAATTTDELLDELNSEIKWMAPVGLLSFLIISSILLFFYTTISVVCFIIAFIIKSSIDNNSYVSDVDGRMDYELEKRLDGREEARRKKIEKLREINRMWRMTYLQDRCEEDENRKSKVVFAG
jgi:hypothetical protein